MKQIRRLLVWSFKTSAAMFLTLCIFALIISPLISDKQTDNNPLLAGLIMFGFLFTLSATFIACWFLEYRNGKTLFINFLKDKTYKLFKLGVSPELRSFTEKMIATNSYDDKTVGDFKMLLNKESLHKEKREQFLRACLNTVLKKYGSDRKLDDTEWPIFLSSRKAFDCSIPENSKFGINEKVIGDYRARGIISEGRLIEFPKEQLPVRSQESEIVFLVIPAHLVKRKKITKRINYSGFSSSVNLGMGIRYRVGTIKPQSIKQEVVAIEDTGLLYITSERVGFHGDRKSWSAAIKTLSDVQVESDVGLEIFKSGRENPILIFPTDIDLAAAVLDILMKGEYNIDSNKVAV